MYRLYITKCLGDCQMSWEGCGGKRL